MHKDFPYHYDLFIYFPALVFCLYSRIFDTYFQRAVQGTRHFNPEANESYVAKFLGAREVAIINVSLIHLVIQKSK